MAKAARQGGLFSAAREAGGYASSQGEPDAASAVSISCSARAQRVCEHLSHDVGPVVLLAQVRGHHMPQPAVQDAACDVSADAALDRWP